MSGIAARKLLLDTNQLIELISGNAVALMAFNRRDIHVSIVNEMELLSFRLNERDEQDIRMFLSKCKIWPIDDAIKEAAIRIRRKHSLRLPDAIVAATASVQHLTLITADKDFTRLPVEEVHVILFQP